MMILRSDHEKIINKALGFSASRSRKLTRIERLSAAVLLALIVGSMVQDLRGQNAQLRTDSSTIKQSEPISLIRWAVNRANAVASSAL